MTSARRLHHTYEDYVRFERESPSKHEYCDGEIYAMAGGTPTHGILGAQLIGLLQRQLPPGCRVMSSDVKVRIAPTDLSTYPDASVVCGALEVDSTDENAVTNPVLVAEVTSPSTEDYDRGEKLSHYKQLPSIRAILIVSHKATRVTVIEREGNDWKVTEYRSSETVTTSQPPLAFPVDVLYEPLKGL